MTLLIVDDEHFTSEGLYRLIIGSSLPFDKIFVARSGEEAVELIKTNAPDIILCDIRMTGINGLEFAQAARKSYPDCQIVFMSGYNDREYIKTALDMKAVAFIDKPIDEDELFEFLGRAVEESIVTKRNNQAVQSMYSEEIAKKILQGGISDEVEIYYANGCIKRTDSFDGGKGSVFRCVLVSPAHINRRYILDLLQELDIWGVCTSDDYKNDVIFVKHAPGKPCNILYTRLIDSDANIKLAIGHTVRGVNYLPLSYKSAGYALDTLFYHSANRLVYSSGNKNKTLGVMPPVSEYSKALEGGTEQAFSYLENLRNRLLDNPYTPPNLVKTHYYSMLHTTMTSYGGKDQIFDNRLIWEECRNAATLQELEMMLFLELTSKKETECDANISHTVRTAKRYIQNQFQSSQLTLTEISKHVHTSNGHLSAIFKKHTGYTLLQYITLCRIEFAKKQLVETNDKMFEISQSAGYSDAYYFGKVFRRETGMTPQQYRIAMYAEY